VRDQLGQRACTQHGHGLDRNALRAGNDGCVADGAADHGIAGTDLFGYIHTTPARHEVDLQAFLFVIAFGLGNHPGAERRQGAGRG